MAASTAGRGGVGASSSVFKKRSDLCIRLRRPSGRASTLACKRSGFSGPSTSPASAYAAGDGLHCLLLFANTRRAATTWRRLQRRRSRVNAAVSVADRVTAPFVAASAPRVSTAAPGRRRSQSGRLATMNSMAREGWTRVGAGQSVRTDASTCVALSSDRVPLRRPAPRAASRVPSGGPAPARSVPARPSTRTRPVA